jgi:hypothetical protein
MKELGGRLGTLLKTMDSNLRREAFDAAFSHTTIADSRLPLLFCLRLTIHSRPPSSSPLSHLSLLTLLSSSPSPPL